MRRTSLIALYAAFPLAVVVAACSGDDSHGAASSGGGSDAGADSSLGDSDASDGQAPPPDAGPDVAASCGDVGQACCATTTCNQGLHCAQGACASTPAPVTFDLVNASLEADAPYEAQRAPYVAEDIAARSAGFACVVGVDSPADRTRIVQAAQPRDGGSGHFPYAYMVTTDDTTPPSVSPTTPPIATPTPPCSGSVSSSAVSAAYSCVEQSCSTVSGGDPSGTGALTSTTCIEMDCLTSFLPLDSQVTAQSTSAQLANDACFDCMLEHLTDGETIGAGETACTTGTATPYAYGGGSPTIILSAYPLLSTSSFVLASTGYRRTVLKAQARLPNQEIVDFFCGQLTSPYLGSSLPYVGPYDGQPDAGSGNGWETEQDGQAAAAAAWIQAQLAADKVPGIVAMDLHADDPPAPPVVDAGTDASEVSDDAAAASASDAGDDAGGDGPGPLTAVSPEVASLFASTFTPAVPAGTTPTCDYCPAPENPYNNVGIEPTELLHVYTAGFPAGATQSTSLWGNQNGEVPLPAAPPGQTSPPGGTGPILLYYGHEVTLMVP